jgi:hypothetical protein
VLNLDLGPKQSLALAEQQQLGSAASHETIVAESAGIVAL